MILSPDSTVLPHLGCIEFRADFESFGVLEISPHVTDVLGYSVEECLESGFLLDRLIHPDDVDGAAASILKAFEEGRVDFSFRAVQQDGSTTMLRAFLAQAEPDERGVPCFGGLLLEGRSALPTTVIEERLKLALNAADMGVWDWRLPERTIYWSDKVYQLHGTSRDDVGDLFENYQQIVDRIHPDDLPTVERTLMHALRSGEDYDIEYRVEQPEDGSRWLSVKGRIYFGDDEEPTRIAGTVQDVTARKTAELSARRELAERRRAEEELTRLTETLEERVRERTSELEAANKKLTEEVAERARAERKLEQLNRQLLQSNRELQDFAHVASHDLREPLRKITTFADLLQTEYAEEMDEEVRFLFERMQSSAMRMTQLIEDLLQFSRVKGQEQPFATVDLNDVVADVLADLEVRIDDADATIRVNDLPSIEADPTQMRQLFQNLIVNAIKFRRQDAPAVVEIEGKIPAGSERLHDRGCRLIVRDNGIGLDPRHAERIFSPFQRLLRDYEGTGMGLTICRRIVERHHGTIAVESAPGMGATFIIDLPLRQTDAAEE